MGFAALNPSYKLIEKAPQVAFAVLGVAKTTTH
jgi:hypothetical protein